MLIYTYITQLHYLFHNFIFTALKHNNAKQYILQVSSCEPYILYHTTIPNKKPISYFRSHNLIYVIEIFGVQTKQSQDFFCSKQTRPVVSYCARFINQTFITFLFITLVFHKCERYFGIQQKYVFTCFYLKLFRTV